MAKFELREDRWIMVDFERMLSLIRECEVLNFDNIAKACIDAQLNEPQLSCILAVVWERGVQSGRAFRESFDPSWFDRNVVDESAVPVSVWSCPECSRQKYVPVDEGNWCCYCGHVS